MIKFALLAAAAVLTAGAAAQADTVAAKPDGTLYFGTGNPNGDFTTATNNFGTLGLRADIRGGALVDPIGDTYTVSAGSVGGFAAWDFVYSIDTAGKPLSGFTALLTVTAPGGATYSFDPLTVPDNGGTTSIAQNAENISFVPPPLVADPNLTGLYTVELTLSGSRGVVLSDTIHVNVVPTPLPSAATMGLGTAALLGAAGMLRKKLRTA